MFYCTNFGQKLNMSMKKKKELTPIHIIEKKLLLSQFTCTCIKNKTVFIKNDIHLRQLVLAVTERERFVLVSRFMKSKTYIMLS